MFLRNIFISNFRNYDQLSLELSPNINIIYGNNYQGKTNLLESIYVLALTKSHRSFIDNSLIKTGQKEAKIKGSLIVDDIPTNLEITLKEKQKTLKIDKEEVKKVSDYVSKMNIIIFYPADLNLITGSPELRRRYLNLELSQLDHQYLVVLSEYNKLLKMRNDYLKKLAFEEVFDDTYLDILTNYLIEKAIFIYKMRYRFISKLNSEISFIFSNITGLENFHLKYKSSINLENLNDETLKELMNEKFGKMQAVEKKYMTTLVGPHRDDFEFYLDKFNLKTHGSQGQQRLAILTLKIGEIEIFKKYRNSMPILLLDDVFSELDIDKKNKLLSYIDNNCQVIITTTDLEQIDEKIIAKAKLIKIENGKLIE